MTGRILVWSGLIEGRSASESGFFSSLRLLLKSTIPWKDLFNRTFAFTLHRP